MEQITISKFKATCLAVLERVHQARVPILVTKRGVPVAEIKPPPGGHRRLARINGWHRRDRRRHCRPSRGSERIGGVRAEMRLLLDTHIWIGLTDPARIKPKVRAALVHRNAELWLSSISVWEALVLIRKGTVRVKDSEASRWIGEALKQRCKFRHGDVGRCLHTPNQEIAAVGQFAAARRPALLGRLKRSGHFPGATKASRQSLATHRNGLLAYAGSRRIQRNQ